jgi:DNA-binding CsgD family transcriptional regulator
VLYGTFRQLGYRKLVYARGQVIDPDKPLHSPASIIERGLPCSWKKHYDEQGQLDPYFRLPCRNVRGMSWSDINSCAEHGSAPVREFIRMVREDLDMPNGFTVPVKVSATRYAIVSAIDLSEERSAESRNNEPMLCLLSHCFVNEATARLERSNTRPVQLSKRESECLFWYARGKTIEEIAAILGISDETVPIYFKRVTSKLDATNRTNALAKAIAMGLIDVDCIATASGPAISRWRC